MSFDTLTRDLKLLANNCSRIIEGRKKCAHALVFVWKLMIYITQTYDIHLENEL